MDDDDIFEAEIQEALDQLKGQLGDLDAFLTFKLKEQEFRDRHILVDGELMEIGEMPKEALALDIPKPKQQTLPRGNSASSVLTIDTNVAEDGSDIAKEWELLFGVAAQEKYRKEKGENNNG